MLKTRDQLLPSNICLLQNQLREKFIELETLTTDKNKLQDELLQMRHSFCQIELLLEDERKTSRELRSKLKTTMSLANKQDTEHSDNTNKRIELKINYESMKRERDFLHEQFKSIKLQCTQLQTKNELLNNDLSREKTSNKSLQTLMNQLEEDIKLTYGRLTDNIKKIYEEKEILMETCNATINFNKRLQVIGLCSRAIHQRDKIKIESLEKELRSLKISKRETQDDIMEHPTIKDLCFKFETMLEELKSKLNDQAEDARFVEEIE